MNREIKQSYKGITKKEAKEDIRLLKKEIKPLKYQVKDLEECIEYLKKIGVK